ncbi:hypothetical protein B0H14DRAFT_2587420 [Mycena olivaceomarginata]|nr:hypothetical protein B0H14DRAFT_2587420 [Mycena olivaceomarginata]
MCVFLDDTRWWHLPHAPLLTHAHQPPLLPQPVPLALALLSVCRLPAELRCAARSPVLLSLSARVLFFRESLLLLSPLLLLAGLILNLPLLTLLVHLPLSHSSRTIPSWHPWNTLWPHKCHTDPPMVLPIPSKCFSLSAVVSDDEGDVEEAAGCCCMRSGGPHIHLAGTPSDVLLTPAPTAHSTLAQGHVRELQLGSGRRHQVREDKGGGSLPLQVLDAARKGTYIDSADPTLAKVHGWLAACPLHSCTRLHADSGKILIMTQRGPAGLLVNVSLVDMSVPSSPGVWAVAPAFAGTPTRLSPAPAPAPTPAPARRVPARQIQPTPAPAPGTGVGEE